MECEFEGKARGSFRNRRLIMATCGRFVFLLLADMRFFVLQVDEFGRDGVGMVAVGLGGLFGVGAFFILHFSQLVWWVVGLRI